MTEETTTTTTRTRLVATAGSPVEDDDDDDDRHNQQQRQQAAATATDTMNDDVPDLSLSDIVDGDNGRGIPSVKFVSEDVGEFVATVLGDPASTTSTSAELLIGAFSQLHAKYKSSEASLQGKQENLKQKIPELQKSISAIQTLIAKRRQRRKKDDDDDGTDDDAKESAVHVRYALSDNIYARAKLVLDDDTAQPSSSSSTTRPVVYLWLGANVMLEYEYADALSFLRNNHSRAEKDLSTISNDLSFVRDQIVTSEVNMSRIFNWDVRRRRDATTATGGGGGNATAMASS